MLFVSHALNKELGLWSINGHGAIHGCQQEDSERMQLSHLAKQILMLLYVQRKCENVSKCSKKNIKLSFRHEESSAMI